MKPNLSLTGILSATAVSGLLLASFNPTGASACFFSKNKGVNTGDAGNSPSLVADKMFKKMAIGGLGLGAVGGVVAAGMVYKARRTRLAKAAVADAPVVHPETISDVTVEEILYAPTAEVKASAAPSDQDLTSVG
jgi:hypothetical protein